MKRNVRERLFSELHRELHRAEIDALHLPEITRNSIVVAVILVKKVVPVDGHTNFLNNLYSKVLISLEKIGAFSVCQTNRKSRLLHLNGGVQI